MNVRSAKAKGMKLQKLLIESLLRHFQSLTSNDLRSIPGSVPGSDVWASERAREVIGKIDWECKNQQNISIWAALKQVEDRALVSGDLPILVFKRNNSKIYCTLELDRFLDILSSYSCWKGDKL
jgi:hypothetical protein